MKRILAMAAVWMAVTVWMTADLVGAQDKAAPEGAQTGTVVLDTQTGPWRRFVTYKTPALLDKDGQSKPFPISAKDSRPARVWNTAWPDKDWTAPEMDDREWGRARGAVGADQHIRDTLWNSGGAAWTALIVARGKFAVEDPAAARGLKVSVAYSGGAVVYLNGKEIARSHLPAGELGFEAVAEPYPLECYIRPDGKQLTPGTNKEFGFDSRDFADRFKARERTLEADVPSNLLRKGVNVLAVAVYRSPCRDVALSAPFSRVTWRGAPGPWPHSRLIRARLTAAPDAGIVPNVGRPKGTQYWTAPAWQEARPDHYADPYEKPLPIRLVGARNAEFSGQVLVGSDQPIAELRVSVSDLADAQGGGRLPASAIAVRYPQWNGQRYEALSSRPPADGKVKVQPVWLTVQVPADAKAGLYEGKVAVRAKGLAAAEVPLAIQVHGWRMTDPADYGTRNHIWQSHDSLALNYKTPLWSDRHFELMGKSLALTQRMGNKFCAIHLITPASDIGNEQTFVRWIKKEGAGGENKDAASATDAYTYDFSVFDRYLDLYAEKVGKPELLLIDVWAWGSDQVRDEKKRVQLKTSGEMTIKVSLLDPKTGQVGLLTPPYHGTREALAFWKPVLGEIRARLEKRGWMESVCLGTASDNRPLPQTVGVFHEIWPDVPWFSTGHMRPAALSKAGGGNVPVRCQEWVWGSGNRWTPGSGKGEYPTPWGEKNYSVAFARAGSGSNILRTGSGLTDYLLNPERTLQANLYGIGRVCADMWQVAGLKDRGWRGWLCGSPGQFNFHASITAFLHRGAEGPELTCRAQMFVEGVQVREAMIFLQRAAKSGKTGPELAGRIKALLEQRARNAVAASGTFQPQQGDRLLFALCAEVQAANPTERP